MRQKLPQLDKGLSSLLQDLDDRGLLDSTIVWCCGEFGRTPRVSVGGAVERRPRALGSTSSPRSSRVADSRAVTWSARPTPGERK